VRAFRLSVTSTPQLVVEVDDVPRPVWVQILGNNTVYLGASDVSSTTGFPIQKHTAPLAGGIPPGESLYCVTADGQTETLCVILQDA
jgi:hypothetical protein